ncbi:MAG TPA: VOC family protein [Pseudolabrys sp.]|nr:VOC family protein [Pseudolabrys sp.]
MQVQSYLFMDGRGDDAIEFYKKALGASVNTLMRFKEMPDGKCAAGSEDKIMHADISIGETHVLLSDGENKGQPNFQGFGLAVTTKTEAEANAAFDALAAGGKVTMPQSKTFFSPRFGMLVDKFGVHWMILAEQ